MRKKSKNIDFWPIFRFWMLDIARYCRLWYAWWFFLFSDQGNEHPASRSNFWAMNIKEIKNQRNQESRKEILEVEIFASWGKLQFSPTVSPQLRMLVRPSVCILSSYHTSCHTILLIFGQKLEDKILRVLVEPDFRKKFFWMIQVRKTVFFGGFWTNSQKVYIRFCSNLQKW